MNVFTIAGIVGILVLFLGILIAYLFVRLSQMVTENEVALEQASATTNPNMTFGYEIPVDADIQEQLAAARKIAARRAANLPRGANMRIGRLGHSNLNTAGKAVEDDPFNAVKIAAFHTWQGAKTGPPIAGAAQATPQARQVAQAAPTKKPEDLVPGEDYPFTEITDDMSADEVRSARIANARARSAAIKALKEQAAQAPAAAQQPEAAAPAPATEEAAATSPADAAAAAGIEEPDYIEITDDMEADEVRKARIHNARARSAYMKALKEAGIDPSKPDAQAAQAPAAEPAAAPQPQPEQPEPATTLPSDIEPPDYIEITDDMPADEVRKARVQNARERSRFYKSLKDRGIDPKEWEAQQEAGNGAAQPQQPTATAEAQSQPAAAVEAEAQQETAAPETEAEAETVQIPDNIAEPDYIEITDDMSPDEVRQARVHNSRERSRFFKALKDAGIDPKTVADQV